MTPHEQSAERLCRMVNDAIGRAELAVLDGPDLIPASENIQLLMDVRDFLEGIFMSAPEPDWLSIYQAYPRKVRKGNAKTAILRALKKVPHDQLLKATKEWADFCKTAYKEECYIPYPASWFNGLGYEDRLGNPMDSNPSLRNVRIAELKAIIRNSPAFPGGPRWTELHTPEEKSKYTEAASELLRLLPGFNMNELRR